MSTYNPNYTELDVFDYTLHFRPTQWPSIASLALFLLLTLITLAQTIKFGDKFMYIIPAMGAAEVLGYITRLVFFQQKDLTTYIVAALFILLPPIALALVNYIVVAKLLSQAGKPVKVFFWSITENRVTKIFLTSDVACFFLQGTGGGLMGMKDAKLYDIGRGIIISGLAIQVAFFSAFLYVLFTISVFQSHGLNRLASLRKVFWCLWITTLLIYIRNIYRLAEFSSTEVISIEWAFYVFESLAIWLSFVAYAIFPFGMLLNQKEFPSDEKPFWIKEHESKHGVVSKDITPAESQSGEA